MFDLMPFGYRNNSLAKFFDSFDKNFFGDMQNMVSEFKTDILDKGDKFVLQAELPGFSKEDINIDIDGDYLTVSATHNTESEEKKESYIKRERTFGSFSRSFNISNIKVDSIKAQYKDGVLELELPKLDAQIPTTKKIAIE